jgi:hypothetical protein
VGTLTANGNYDESTGTFTYFLDFLELEDLGVESFVNGQEYTISINTKTTQTSEQTITISCSDECSAPGSHLPCAENVDVCTEAISILP